MQRSRYQPVVDANNCSGQRSASLETGAEISIVSEIYGIKLGVGISTNIYQVWDLGKFTDLKEKFMDGINLSWSILTS